jgi:7-carboxy-7-deazaguanine synthase
MRIAEIFQSIAGECNGLHQGVITTFIRMQGCNLRCSFCDTEDTQSSKDGEQMHGSAIVSEVAKLGNEVVCITGGEPLKQFSALYNLCNALKNAGYRIVIETNGSYNVGQLSSLVDSVVMDYKFEYEGKMDIYRFADLRSKDVIKFVIESEVQLEKAIKIQDDLLLNYDCRAMFAYSPVILTGVSPLDSMDYQWFINNLMKLNKNSCVLSVQLHKLIGIA